LFRRLSEEGRSILCITHNVENVEQCHLVLVLAKGKLIYYGPPREAPAYFKVRRISDVYDRVAERDLEAWEKDFASSDVSREYVRDRLAAAEREEPVEVKPEAEQPAPTRLAAVLAESRKLVEERLPPLADYFRQLEAGKLRWRDVFAPARETWHQLR